MAPEGKRESPLINRWWRPAFVEVRADAALAVTYAAAFAFCRSSRRAREKGGGATATASAVMLLIVYAIAFSSFAADAIMSLEPSWTSTLFPAYVFTGNVYAGIVAVALIAAWGGEALLTVSRSRDVANVIVAAALFWFYLFWSQFLVIWYGNLTSEVGYVMRHVDAARALAWAVLLLACALPAVVFIPDRGKRAFAVKAASPFIFAGLWLERWLLAAPDLAPASLTTAASLAVIFAVVFLACVRAPLSGTSTTRRPKPAAHPR